MTLLWCSSKFAQLYKVSLCNKINIQPLWNIDNIAPLVVNVYLGLRPREIFVRCVQYLASERSERAQSCSCSIEISDTYVYIYMYICMWSYVKLCMRMLGGTYCGRG